MAHVNACRNDCPKGINVSPIRIVLRINMPQRNCLKGINVIA